jgi:hypothetical protein
VTELRVIESRRGVTDSSPRKSFFVGRRGSLFILIVDIYTIQSEDRIVILLGDEKEDLADHDGSRTISFRKKGELWCNRNLNMPQKHISTFDRDSEVDLLFPKRRKSLELSIYSI